MEDPEESSSLEHDEGVTMSEVVESDMELEIGNADVDTIVQSLMAKK